MKTRINLNIWLAMSVFLLIACLANNASALHIEWDSRGSPEPNDWNTPENWVWNDGSLPGPGVPELGEQARVSKGLSSNQQPIIHSGVNAVAGLIIIGRTTGRDSLTILSGGTLTTQSQVRLGQKPGYIGTLNIFGGSLDTTDPTVNEHGGGGKGGDVRVGYYGTGYLNMDGGTITTRAFYIARQDGSTGHVNLDGGTINVVDVGAKTAYFRMGGGIDRTGTMNITDGTLIIDGNCVDKIQGYVDNGWITAHGTGTPPNMISDPMATLSILYNPSTDKTTMQAVWLSRGDLMATAVDVLGNPIAGRPLHITWAVQNIDTENTIGRGVYDGIYLSSDEQWGIDDLLMAAVQHNEQIGPQESYQAETDVVIPGVSPGNYYILVHTDLGNHVEEPDGENNNTIASEQIFVDVEELVVGVAVDSNFINTERSRYYRITVPESKDLEIHLDDLDDMGENELYVSFEAIPTRSRFDYRYETNFAPDQTVRIPGTSAGIYYILAYADGIPGAGPAQFSITAQYLPLQITDISPDKCGNSELSTPTVTVYGSHFDPNAVVLLQRDGQTDITPTELTWLDTGTISAKFNLHGAAAGAWDLTVINPNSESTSFPFTVVEGGTPNLETRLVLPDALGFHRRATLWIEYANTGDAPMPAPLLKLHGGQDALLTGDESLAGPGLWTANPPARLKDTVQVLAIGSGSDPGVLNPGESGRIPVHYRGCKRPWDFSYLPIEFTLGVLTADDTTPIDWAEVEADVRPDDIADDLWAVIWPRIKVRIGPTWGHYLQMLNSNAKYLTNERKKIHWKQGYKRRAHIVRELFALEVAKAMGAFIPPRTLVSTVDAYHSAPGLPLVFGRVAIDTTTQRFALGPFGRGWSHNFEYSLELPDEFTAIVKSPNGTTRTFSRNQGYPWQAAEGDFGTLEDMPGGAHRLREKRGLVWFFGSNGALAYMQEPNGNRVTLSYTAGKLTAVNHSNGQSFTIVYNAGGFVKTITDPVGRQTQYTYDGSGEHLVSVTSPGNILTFYVYNPVVGEPNDHALTSITFPNASHMYFDYDVEGRLIGQWRDGHAEKVEFIYQSFNKVIVQDASGAETTLHYGLPRQLLKVENPLGNVISFEYEDNFLNEITGPDGSSYQSVYDGQGNLIGTKDPLGNTISLSYTSGNYLEWLVDQKGNRTDFTTDSSGNLTATTYSDSTTESFTYDSSGNVLSWANRRGDTVTYTYNAAGQVIGKDYPNTPAIDYQYTYDATGNLITATDASGTITITYDPNTNWMTRIEYPGGHFFAFEYDSIGRRTKRTDQNGRMVNYIYDAIGRLDRITDGSDALIADYDYDASGRMVRKALGNGVYTTYEYDAAGQLTHLVNYSPSNTIISRFGYTYNENGNRTSMTTLAGTYSYGYDLLGQLTTVTYPDGHVVSYLYDAAGNRIEVIDNGVSTAYTTNTMNQYTNVGGTTYTYDEDGNMETKTESGVTTTYTYNIENRLIGVSTPTDTWTYTYDAFGNRIASTHNGVETSYVIDPIGFGNVAAEYDGVGDLIASYDHGFGLLSRTDTVGNPAYYTFDAIGSTSEVTDPTGLVLNSYTYDPFGISLSKSEVIANLFEYIGEYGVMNETNGLEFMRARYYDPQIGRFIKEDFVRFYGSNTNAYVYAGNNPTSFIDPAGLSGLSDLAALARQALRGKLVSWLDVSEAVGRAGLDIIPGAGGLAELAALAGRSLGGEHVSWLDVSEAVGRAGLGLIPGASVLADLAALAGRSLGGETITLEEISEVVGSSGLTLFSDQIGGIDVVGDLMSQLILTPDAPTPKVGGGDTNPVGTLDPNKKIGPKGYGSGGFIVSDPSSIVYTVYFENEPNATAAALLVRIEDQLDEDLDWTTFELLEVGFENHQITVPSGMSHHEETLAIEGWTWSVSQGWHTGETPLKVDVSADIDISTGLVTWLIKAYDPVTGWEPEDAYAGFLPPDDQNDITHRGEGYVSFLIHLKPGLATGTQITNMAGIYFDFNPVIETPAVLNTIDDGVPSSSVLPLPAITEETSFTVTWSGQDDAGGCGIASYDIYVSTDDGDYTLWLDDINDTSAVMNGQDGSTYAFYSVATDNVGNVEQVPGQPDAMTTILINDPPIANAGSDQTVYVGTSCQATVTLDANGSTDPDGDELTYRWLIDGQQIAAGVSPTIVLPLGERIIELIVNDGVYDSEPDYVEITVLDGTAPEIVCPSDVTLECPADTSVGANGSATATDNCDPAPAISFVDSSVPSCGNTEIITRMWTATDESSNSSSCEQIITVVDTTSPTISNLNADYLLAAIGQTVTFSADVLDDCDNDVDVEWDFGNGTAPSSNPTHIYELANIYNVTVTATDDCSNATTDSIIVVVYDPGAGFTTGGGWFVPDSNSFIDGNSVTDTVSKANFGFIVKYKKGADNPDGNLEFQYKAGDINLRSSDMEWLVVQSATKVRFKGQATINGQGLYTFKVTAEDNGEPGTGDCFKIEIWLGPDVDTENSPPTPKHKAQGFLGGGNIQIHQK